MIILITGACGFVGAEISELLNKNGNRIIGIGRSKDCKCKTIKEYYQCDISNDIDINTLMKRVPKCDVVVHVAGNISFDNFNSNIIDDNCKGTLQIGHFALLTGAKQIIYISSIQVVSKPEIVPITEVNNCEKPITLYHLTKYLGEKILQLPEFNDLTVSILRITAPISPYMPANRMLPLFITKAMNGEPIVLHGKGNRVQNYVDTRDIAKAVLCAINQIKPGLFLIGGQSISNKEIALMCNEICKSSAGVEFSGVIDPEDDYRWIISNDKSYKELGYKPEYKVIDTLIEMKDLLERRI